MPLKIDQLVINARVVPDSTSNGAANSATTQQGNQDQRQAIVEQCISEVLRILEERSER